ncbi:hypothetical protein BGZ61DRAFT_586316 [Ilyonectria robusta]|uniref:uncharacterized protein n=1 Tax=Ilyonectria robusta TaxID=1079257 RepID=UPI001E8CC839|nr:uncharacterized protein BGZ61DRAFT_586316 [Ilyonectria robusta]KAH8729823.1 hypothetical protein BGZ61DRAFT_586316 [Ilyonectria robusta]
MVGTNKSGEDAEGSKRAADFHNAMLGTGYADDSMLYVVRYVNSVKQKLRECDADEFMRCFGELNRLWSETQPEAPEGAASRYEKARELKQQALETIKDCPDLVRDFDRFTTNGRVLMRNMAALRPGK